jgi:regulator of sirC expression with transglutaminase-like and TPR domain
METRLLVIGAASLAVVAASATVWLWAGDTAEPEIASLALPVPPFPPRIAQGETYEHCLALLANDPSGASTLAETWAAQGGGEGAAHCEALAQIALGRPEAGAAQLERLAATSKAPDLARASLLAQAVQARLMADQPDRAQAAATTALGLSPDDIELLIDRATADQALQQSEPAIEDLSHVLELDPMRVDALVLRAAAWRRLDKLDMAAADITRALELDPQEPEALLERGILRQRQGDRVGARHDWQRARMIDPNSTTADLADQNLALLEAGPDRR